MSSSAQADDPVIEARMKKVFFDVEYWILRFRGV